MSDQARQHSEEDAIKRIRSHVKEIDPIKLSASLLSGDRVALSQAITCVETGQGKNHSIAQQIIRNCLPHSGKSLRIGITGVPGVGKSTYIDTFGMYLTGIGKKVAVLAIDPTSQITGGSILGDKTRMEKLSANTGVFIRPSPSANTLGGVARKTRETIILCEAAGFDIILVETVGVGQSETAVHGMTDFFLLLMLAGAGDQLQGIKRGIMEMCDAMLITKSDGDNVKKASLARSEYFSALHLFPPRHDGWSPKVEMVSAFEGTGIEKSWEIVAEFEHWMVQRDLFEERRQQQDISWMHDTIRARLTEEFYTSSENIKRIKHAELQVRNRNISAFEAAENLLSAKN